MSRSRLLILLGLFLLMTVPVGMAEAQGTQPEVSGTAVVSDGLAQNDRITYEFSNVPLPGEGMAYEGWLVSDDGSRSISTGVMNVGADGLIEHSFTSPSGEDFIANYSRVQITREPVPDNNPESSSGDVVYQDSWSAGAGEHIRHLLVAWPPDADSGIIANLQEQLDTAMQHADLARNSTTLEDLRLHTHHVINIIEGEDGPNFDASFGNPGDGLGVLAHAQDANNHANLAANAAPNDDIVNEHADMVIAAANNAESWAIEARDHALNVLEQDSLANASTLLNTVYGRLTAARSGISATESGGADQAYVEAQLMGSFTFPGRTTGGTGFGIGLPSVGGTALPSVIEGALAVSIGLLATGGFLLYRSRRSRTTP